MLKIMWLAVLLFIVLSASYLLINYFPSNGEMTDNSEFNPGLEGQRENVVKNINKRSLQEEQLELSNKLLPKKASPVTLSESQLVELQQLSDVKKGEIEALMVKLDGSLDNPDERKLIKADLKKKMDEYNRLILPLALKSMEENNQPET